MPIPRSDYLSNVWRDGIFGLHSFTPPKTITTLMPLLENKVVFCTGGAGSICSAQVRALVHLGANACIIGRNASKTETMAQDIATARLGAKVIGIGGADVRSIESLQSCVERCVKELGGIDYVIAGAAGNFIAPISGLSANAFKTVIDIDLLGAYNTLKATLPYLLESASKNPNTGTNTSTGGRIIFISATFHFTGMALQAHAAAAKSGIDALSATAAIEFGPRGITSNVITPGPISGTEGMERLGTRDAEASGLAQKKVPLQRYGTVKEIADATVYLFSDSGNFVNGAVQVVDGGDWRSPGGMTTRQYPDYLLDGEIPNASYRKSKL